MKTLILAIISLTVISCGVLKKHSTKASSSSQSTTQSSNIASTASETNASLLQSGNATTTGTVTITDNGEELTVTETEETVKYGTDSVGNVVPTESTTKSTTRTYKKNDAKSQSSATQIASGESSTNIDNKTQTASAANQSSMDDNNSQASESDVKRVALAWYYWLAIVVAISIAAWYMYNQSVWGRLASAIKKLFNP